MVSPRLLLPAFRTHTVCADAFPDRLFAVVYTSMANGTRFALPPPRAGAGAYTFPQAVRVAMDLIAKTPEWGGDERPRIVSIDGLTPVVTVSAADIVNLGQMALFLSAVAGAPIVLELPPVRLPAADRGDEEDDD